ncbi:sulfate/thiosulfate transporter subunit [Escherichia coli SHECO001]|uniref:sulfate/thiosulfate ABC transporter ATP-binding protein CysA n=1 Tax=Escherichia coli TaxID=562 RepID=UPI000A18A124|nr:sulfate/thiosulfate ABC transporter ATP-binding protein CysA [Escherichia coli]OSK05815.1 sulfate/thiosulfate transporter subunit [Escherichia coli SHECO001]
MSIEIANIKKSFGRTQVLNDISLDIPSGQMVALLGPSGSGKTTLLRIIAGLEHQTSGHIRFHGTDVSRLHARDRKVGFVFQHYALFRHMTVFDNIAFGLTVLPRRERPNAAAIKAKVTKLLEMVQLAHLADRYPAQLSGGQKQRVALARALAVEPQILLLDEPFGALDAQVRKELRRWLRQLHEELKFTSVFVTHDQEEATEVADRVVVMSQGNIEQADAPNQVWREPATRFVLEFMGEVNRLQGTIRGGQFHVGAHRWPLGYTPAYQGPVDSSCFFFEPATRFVLEFMGEVNRLQGTIRGGQFHVGAHRWPLGYTPAYQGPVDLFLRPWEVDISRRTSLDSPLPVQVLEASPKGHYTQLVVQPLGWYNEPLTVVMHGDDAPQRGERLFVGLQHARLYNGDERIETRDEELALAQSA